MKGPTSGASCAAWTGSADQAGVIPQAKAVRRSLSMSAMEEERSTWTCNSSPSASSSGRSNQNVVPTPGSLAMRAWLPCFSRMPRTIDSPSPVPASV